MFFPNVTFDDKEYYVAVKPDNVAKFLGIKVSYQIIAARLLGFSYPDYLRYGRSKGATIRGRTGYSCLYFSSKENCQNFCDELNTEWNKFSEAIIREKEGFNIWLESQKI